MIRALTLALLITLLLAGCSRDEAPLPGYAPLTAGAEQLATLHGIARGPFGVLKAQVTKRFEAQDKDLHLTVTYPGDDGIYPLVVFSHGNFSDRRQYDAVIDHWVSHGYVVVAPDHHDAGGMVAGIWAMIRHGQVDLMRYRPDDMIFVIDHMDDILKGLPVRVDLTRIAATGHSFGAFVAQMMGGASAVDPDTGAQILSPDPRIRAVVALSPPGPMFDMITDQSWLQHRLPQLVTTGTWDRNAEFWPDWRLHAMSFDTAPEAEDNYLLVVQGMDHYLGNLICRLDRDEDPQPDALKMVLSATTAFLDAYVKEDQTALRFLTTGRLAEVTADFAVIERR